MVFGHTFEVPQTSFFSGRKKTQICPCQHLFQILEVWKKISEIEMGDFRKRGGGWKWGEGKPQLSSGVVGSFGGLDVGTSLSLFLRYTPRGWREKSSKGVGEEGRGKNFSFFCLFLPSLLLPLLLVRENVECSHQVNYYCLGGPPSSVLFLFSFFFFSSPLGTLSQRCRHTPSFSSSFFLWMESYS